MLEFDDESLVDIFNELILLKEVKRKKIDLDISKIETSKLGSTDDKDVDDVDNLVSPNDDSVG